MSELKIKAPVGKATKAPKNRPEDVKIVETLLNRFIEAGQLSGVPMLNADGTCDSATVSAITKFQKDVLNFSNPDGRVDPGGKTFGKLLEGPPDPLARLKTIALATWNVAAGPVGGVPLDLWNKTLQSLIKHSGHPKLVKPHLITMVDFRKPNTGKRLWTINLNTRNVLFHALVSHGSGSGRTAVPTKFSNTTGSNMSSVGPYITLHSYASHIGKKEKTGPKGLAMRVEGLTKTNNRARYRGILFHQGWYVTKNRAGTSLGCFATHKDVNPALIGKIQDGSFVYAYAGEKWLKG